MPYQWHLQEHQKERAQTTRCVGVYSTVVPILADILPQIAAWLVNLVLMAVAFGLALEVMAVTVEAVVAVEGEN